MFRPLRRKGRAISDEAARDLLEQEGRGIIAVNGDNGYPFAVPVNYRFDRAADRIYFHGAQAGHKVDALAKSDKVCFTVYGNEHFVEGEWAPYVQSTVVFGRCHRIEDHDRAVSTLRELALKYYPTEEEVDAEIAKDIKGVQVYEIEIEHLTGKQVQEK